MLDEFVQEPGSRVFHLDDECYVIYVGSHWDDYKPFVRIGTSEKLPEQLKPIISTIVVPDMLTGNPLDEPESLNGRTTKDTRYLGDAKTVERFKTFLHEENVASESFQAADHEEEDARHVFVYFYADGNIRVKFKKHDVFDLKKREQTDHHFTVHAQQAKNRFGRSPFKLPGDIYQRPSFAVVAGRPYLIARGEIAALELAPSYFTELASAGIDPDRVATVRAPQADQALIRLFKRSRSRSRSLHIATGDAERVSSAIALFGESSLPGLNATVLDSGPDQFEFHRYQATAFAGGFTAQLDGLPGPIRFESNVGKKAAGDAAAVAVGLSGNSLALRSGDEVLDLPLLEGVPYAVVEKPLTRSGITATYLPEKNLPYRDVLNQTENNIVGQLEYFFNELWNGRDTGKVIKTLRPMLRSEEGASSILMRFIRHNVREFLRYLTATEADVAKRADALAAALGRDPEDLTGFESYLPIAADVYLTDDGPFCFYRHAARITSDRIAHAQQVHAEIAAQPMGTDYTAERGRLDELIAALADPEQMEAARERRRRQAEEAAAKEAAAKEAADKPATTSTAKKPSSSISPHSGDGATRSTTGGSEGRTGSTGQKQTDGRAGAAGDHGARGARGGSDRGSSLRWIIPAAVLLVILVLAGLIFTGVIPNPFGAGRTTELAGSSSAVDPDDPVDDGGGLAAGGDDASGDTTGDDSGDTDGGAASGDDANAGGDDAATAGDGGSTDGGSTDGDSGLPGEPGLPGTDDGPDVELPTPEGWPEEAIPALDVLRSIPGIVITDERVVGPGGIEITVLDIITLVNRIATDNGYARMHVEVPREEDPDWIYPGNIFVLPDESRYTVVQGDTLWDVTIRYMVARLQDDHARYTALANEYDRAGTGAERRREIIQTLTTLAERSHSENFVRLVDEKKAEWER